MTYQELLKKFLPDEVTIPSSFEVIGTVAMIYL